MMRLSSVTVGFKASVVFGSNSSDFRWGIVGKPQSFYMRASEKKAYHQEVLILRMRPVWEI